MDSNLQSSSPDTADAKAAFRKPSNDAANRKYRRRSPISGSSSSDGSPTWERGSSPISSREDLAKVSDHRQRKDDGRGLDRDSGRSQYGRNGDSYRHSDRQSSRSSHSYHRHDGYNRHEKHADEEERTYSKLSSRSGRESRDYLRDVDKYSRDKFDGSGHRSRDKDRETSSREYQKYKDKDSSYDRAGSGRRHSNLIVEETKPWVRDRHMGDTDARDEKRDYRRSLADYRSNRSPTNEESKGQHNDSTSRRDSSGRRLQEASKSDPKELDSKKYTKEEKKKYEDQESNRHKERYSREPGELFEDKTVSTDENQESAAKKPKLFSLDRVSKLTTIADERQSSSSKQAKEFVGKVTSDEAHAKDEAANDIDAAKVAAMKAAELVNRNLIGTGYLSTDQKKKLLWGNKKNTIAEESGHRWDTTLFSDLERQEKFNKLMGVKGDLKMEHKPNNQDGSGLLQAEKQKELQLDLEKQYTAGLRRRDGRTVGLGL
uniref:Putative arginine/serine-rich coiled-coil protein 2 isoform X2 n=1 Tax=Davidia involucrata TaxID=16924 RepID=A0A5B6Z8K2_DAVIN